MIITEKRSKLILFFIYMAAAVIIVLDSKTTVLGIKEGLRLCARYIVPSLFMMCTVSCVLVSSPYSDNLFTRCLARMFALPPNCGAAVFFGLFAGFPSGALGVCELYEMGEIGKGACERAVYFTNNAGLAFIVGTVGALFGNTRFAEVLFVSQTLASLTLANVFRGKREEKKPAKGHLVEQMTFVQGVKRGGATMVTVCSFVCFFTAVRLLAVDVLESFIHDSTKIGLAVSVLEIGNGVKYAAELGKGGIALCAFVTGFGGLSAILQSVAVCPCVRPLRYVAARIMTGLLCAGYTAVIGGAFGVV